MLYNDQSQQPQQQRVQYFRTPASQQNQIQTTNTEQPTNSHDT